MPATGESIRNKMDASYNRTNNIMDGSNSREVTARLPSE
jgi:hypothetical protein